MVPLGLSGVCPLGLLYRAWRKKDVNPRAGPQPAQSFTHIISTWAPGALFSEKQDRIW